MHKKAIWESSIFAEKTNVEKNDKFLKKSIDKRRSI